MIKSSPGDGESHYKSAKTGEINSHGLFRLEVAKARQKGGQTLLVLKF